MKSVSSKEAQNHFGELMNQAVKITGNYKIR